MGVRRVLPREYILDRWAAGDSAHVIALRIGPIDGAMFTTGAITDVIVKARKAGDRRAHRRHYS